MWELLSLKALIMDRPLSAVSNTKNIVKTAINKILIADFIVIVSDLLDAPILGGGGFMNLLVWRARILANPPLQNLALDCNRVINSM